jgi:DNA polymerase-1
MRTLILDADVFAYQAAFLSQKAVEWDEDVWTVQGSLSEAKLQLDDHVAKVCGALKADRMVMCLTDSANWRKDVMPTYKLTRSKNAKPILLKPLREYIHSRYETYQRPGLEGDDVLGILSTHPTLLPGQKIIVTIDKDLKGVPGFLVNLADCSGEDWSPFIREVDEDSANYFHLLQGLAGDPTDGYSGCPGIGMKTAEKLLKVSDLWGEDNATFDVAAAWKVIVAQYAKKGLGEEVALMNTRVARILRAGEWDNKTKSVKLWSPRER